MEENESNRPCLLLVDDHQDTVALQALLLRKDGYDVVTAETADRALAVAAEQTLDLVVTDIRLPDRHGTELMQELHDRYGLRGIALTGAAEEAATADWQARGFVQILLKPVRPEQLTQAVEGALRQR